MGIIRGFFLSNEMLQNDFFYSKDSDISNCVPDN